jgi:hypothetical protein
VYDDYDMLLFWHTDMMIQTGLDVDAIFCKAMKFNIIPMTLTVFVNNISSNCHRIW